jgi:3-phosphoinositide dependent protein kinase-1
MKEGIMHRDMKPQNIMLDESYNIKIIDFGDARKVDEEAEPCDEEAQEGEMPHSGPALMRRDTFVGTVNYQSPEVINGEEQGFGVDIWALGNVLFKMFTGYVPFKGTNPHTVYKDIKNRNIGWPDEEIRDKMISKEA